MIDLSCQLGVVMAAAGCLFAVFFGVLWWDSELSRRSWRTPAYLAKDELLASPGPGVPAGPREDAGG